MAGNSISFAVRVLQATHPGIAAADVHGPTVRGIAIAVATATCFTHAISRRGGILLNNVLALVKVGILLLIIITSIVVAARGFKDEAGNVVQNVIGDNTSGSSAFSDASNEANGYAHAFLSIGKGNESQRHLGPLTRASVCIFGLRPAEHRKSLGPYVFDAHET